MNNRFLKKGCVLVLIFLFVNILNIPSTGNFISKNQVLIEDKLSFSNFNSVNNLYDLEKKQNINYIENTSLYGFYNDAINENIAKILINPILLPPVINFPYEGEVFRVEDIIEINGIASMPDFENYIIEWGVGQDPTDWYTDGITLVNNGMTEIIDGILGSWDTASISETDYYSIKLTVYTTGFDQYSCEVSFYLDSTLHPNFPIGWPYEIPGSQVAIWSPIALSDINKDGYQEIGFGTVTVVPAGDNNKDFVIDHMGNILQGWPIKIYGIQGSSLTFSNIDSSTDNKEVIGGMWGIQLFVWHDNGVLVDGWPQNIYASRASATVNDIDLDGDLEIILPSTDGGGYIYSWHHDGTLVNGWPVYIGSPVRRAASTADIDDDSYPEILFGDQDGYFYVLNHDGTSADGWPQLAHDWIKDSPVIADIEGDGDLEIIISSGFTQKRMIFIWHHDGTLVDGWPQENGLCFVQPSVGDIDDDGDLEILAGGSVPNKPYTRFFVWHHDGTIADGWPIEFLYDPNQDVNYIYAQPVIGDIDGDNDVEIIVGSYANKLYAWHHDGSDVTGWPKIIGDSVDSTAAIGDIDKDGLVEVVVAGDDGKVYVWDMEGEFISSNMEWPMFQHDPYHTGFYGTEIYENQPPDKPDIYGPNSLKVNEEGTFTVSAIDPDDDKVYFYIDWGDGNFLDWDGPYDSAEIVDYQYTWTIKDTYMIKVKAKDIYDEKSDLTEFEIKISNPRMRAWWRIIDIFPIILRLLDL